MKIRVWSLSTLSACAALLSACDDGRIYPSSDSDSEGSGRSVVMKGSVVGCSDFYGADFSVVLAAFSEDNRFASVTKTVKNGDDDILLANIPKDATSVELCVINRLRERIFTLASLPLDGGASDEITFSVGTVDAAPFKVMENGIFMTTCSQCHGATGHAAAGLDLLPEEAYAMLVDTPSTVVEGEMRVKPGEASASTLWQALATGISDSWAFSHSNLLTFEKTDFIESWINKGAEK